MKFVSAQNMREGEGRAILRTPALDQTLMDHAGRGLAGVIAEMATHLDHPDPGIRLLAGPGNNGGDVFAAALFLADMGFAPEIWIACPVEKIKGAARHFFDEAAAEEIPWHELLAAEDWDPVRDVAPPPILVDGLLGTGGQGAPTGIIRAAIEYLNVKSRECLVISADIPSGMNADTGAAAGPVVQADYTVTMGFPKAGMAAPAAAEALGSLRSVSIGLPGEFADAIPDARPGLQWISEADVRRILPRRRRDSHKGTYGRALLLGGSPAYPGAIVLAAEGAARSGAGLVRVATVESAASAVVVRVPEAIIGADLSPDFPLAGTDAILAGPGLGRDPEARRLVARLLHETPGPLVLDADAIAVLEGKPEVVKNCAHPVVLTPHPGELARLLGTDAAAIQRDRLTAAQKAAELTGAIVVLKGAGTLVAKTGQPVWINLNGNPGMACGGSGDVLAGLLAGLLAQKLDPLQAACAAVWLHGTAGDIAALQKTQAAMKAGDIARCLPAAFRQARLR
ncbi:MAG: NAD(P)H-hydrate dehydratase [Kiritimatiellae bacterium]|jgi:NAD(P)H-hydrate epimerase|nr:NAD(P)H-hydrate dehydratase [Kiritimatiellia bacterium]NLD89051.1 NAD(P)H-hydrate dehydratase [Lentisphaerota bacterium]HOU21752.1 NAD(P)H-hydrate dehydratase [Kiritimatiellia bacterium]HPC19701.1 NAD(P)H-hydrate dehydratase [Kiritimatiellia bacterium]HQN79652.1 NAD(P)H-hydrate dehydratase [Kiritimatiellia bacterium]